MKTLKLDNMNFRYVDVGEGPMIVLLHGFGGHPHDWKDVVSHLSQGHRVVVPYLSPFFTSELPQTFSQQVRIVCKLILLLNQHEEPFHVAGTSYGGALSWGVRIHLGSLVRSHTLINPMPLDPTEHIHDFFVRTALFASRLPLGLELLFRTRFGRKTIRQMGQIFHMGLVGKRKIQNFNSRKYKLVYGALKRFMWISKNENWAPWLETAKDFIPTALIFGNQDKLFRKESFGIYCQNVKKCHTSEVPHLGHLLVRHRPQTRL